MKSIYCIDLHVHTCHIELASIRPPIVLFSVRLSDH